MTRTTSKFLIITLLFIATLIQGCANYTANQAKSPEIAINIAEPDRIRFQGKGAGAGMMLTSAMGAMGIAIGVAIDEGIAKEIDQSAQQAGFDIDQLTREAFTQAWQGQATTATAITVDVEFYGFILKPGENDPVTPEIRIKLTTDKGQEKSIKYPEDFSPDSLETAPLEEVKTNGQKTVELYQQALSKLAANSI